MCLALPAQVLDHDADAETATVSLGGVKKTISVALLDGVTAGEFVLVHVGYALNRISEEEAAATLKTMQDAGLLEPALEEASA